MASDNLIESVERAGELLRVLVYLAEPLREETSLLPTLEPDTQHEFFDALCTQFVTVETLLGERDAADDRLHQITQSAILLARLLQFDLGFRGAWTSRAKEASTGLSATLFRLALVREIINSSGYVTDLEITVARRWK